ncbi:CRP-like cAMP-binding protein [Devosia sp. UYZn731]|uniref:Crp/Fnr family transcriptional regulator n=1 Tax=Devosia sp. UYZn731 TaxID=3156345 RepID=UPI0033982CC6
MIQSPQYAGPNRLLQSLSDADFDLLRLHLDPVSLTMRQSLEVADRIPRDIFFMEGSVASVVATLRGGKNFEVGLIGWEGMTGTSILVGAPSPFDCYVQFVGPALRLPAKGLVSAFAQSDTLRWALELYAHMLSVQTAYTALASAHAPIQKRLARWLLMIHDRVEGDRFPVTHEFLSIMLGVRRPGITTTLHELESMHLVKSTRGALTILDRDGLLALAGDGYGKTERSYDDLISAVDPELIPLRVTTNQ